MGFENITKDTPCDCLKDALLDTETIFARVLNKDTISDKDFYSKWDKGHTSELCEEVCGLKGVSVSKIENDAIKQEIIGLYSQVFKISPKYRRGVLLFKFKEVAGLLKPTPDEFNKYHHDFYKTDSFNLSLIEQSIIEFLNPASSV